MGILQNLKDRISKIPEFSDKSFTLAGYIAAGCITASGLFFIYEVFANDALTFTANWNMFNNLFGELCILIGFVLAIVNWGKFGHWSSTPVIETRDRSGNLIERKEDFDVMEQGFAKILMPILGHFIIEPLVYGALIYYPIQCIIAVVGIIFPYVIAVLVVGISACAWMFTSKATFRYRSAVLVFAGVLFTAAFAIGGYSCMPEKSSEIIYGDSTEESLEQNVGQADDYDQATEEASEVPEDEGEGDYGVPGGLMGSLPIGVTYFEGDMDSYPIEFTINKTSDVDVSGTYKNVKYGTTMELAGESTPAMDGDIVFYGNENGRNWTFTLTGDIENISGTASGEGKEMTVTLHRQ